VLAHRVGGIQKNGTTVMRKLSEIDRFTGSPNSSVATTSIDWTARPSSGSLNVSTNAVRSYFCDMSSPPASESDWSAASSTVPWHASHQSTGIHATRVVDPAVQVKRRKSFSFRGSAFASAHSARSRRA
jgi:hypothetical protein